MQRGKAVTLRAYQKRIVDESITDNTLVVLPTGAGKTLIAGEIIRRTGVPALFLVPTVLLVSQQRQALAEWTGMNVEPYCGAMALPRSFDILVSTPKAFELAQTKPANKHFQWGALRTVVFDEVHHVLKNHPYRMLALSLRSSPSKPYVMGLTASYTYAVGESKVKKQLTTLCKELLIKNLQTADDDELRASGYHALGTKSERPAAAIAADDECPPGVVPRDERKPHLMLKMFINRIVKKTGTTFAQALMATVLEMEKEAARLDSGFKPLVMEGGSVKSWGSAANKRAVVAARRRGSGNLPAIFQQLENWYESLRLLIVSWEESDFLSVLLLRMTLCDSETAKDMWSHSVQSTMGRFWKAAPTDFRRLNNLRETLLAKFHEKNPFRGILFVQQRITTHILEHFVANDQQLSLQFSTACIYASSTPATPSFRVTKAQAQERLSDFAAGKVNLLITTVVAEEGMDVPAANCVIRFDPMQHAVSLVQGRGRARQADSSFVVLSERSDRSASVLEKTEQTQRDLLSSFDKNNIGSVDLEKERTAQRSRERGASAGITTDEVDEANALAMLNLFCTKTKVLCQCSQAGKKGEFETFLVYNSVLRSVSGRGTGANKKVAKRAAALELVLLLRQDLADNP